MSSNTVVLVAVAWFWAVHVAAQLHVVATLPDFASIAQEIGGEQIKTTALAKGTEDAHFVDARPSFIRVLNRADVLIEGGAELEIGWLPPLVQNARNSRILSGGPGRVNAARGIALLDVPTTSVDRSQGDVHPHGNPHYWLDPANGKIMAAQLAALFARLDPDHAASYQANLDRFNQRLDGKLVEWLGRMTPFRGVKILTYHKSFEYFARRFDLVIVGQLEPKPGIEPSPAHVADLMARAKTAGVKLVVVEPFRPRRTPDHLAQSIGAKLLLLPDKVQGHRDVKDYFGLFDHNIAQITAALKEFP